MPKTYRISENEVKALRERMKECKKVRVYRRLEAVAMRGEGKSNEEIGPMTGFHPGWVSKLVSRFCNEGINALLEDGRNGGNNQNLTNEQEAKLLKEFEGAARDGQIITPGEIKKRYDEVLGRETKPSFIYSVLKRHGWRKVMPRSRHPKKASEEVIEASKKLTLGWRS
jgi:transposase